MQLDQIIKELADRNLSAVSRQTGLNSATLHRIIRGKVKPHRSTLKVLEMYLTRNQQQ